MRDIKILSIIIISILIPYVSSAQIWFNNPESVEYDFNNNKWIISNCGNGTIVQIDSLGEFSYFQTGLSEPLGIHINGNILYVSTNTLRGFDLETGEQVMSLSLPATQHIDGITSDDSGFLYVIDTGGRIFKVNPGDQSYTTFVSSGLAAYPQDMIFDDENNRLLVVGWSYHAPVQAVSLEDSSVTTLIYTSTGYFDGITEDQNGNVYLASHFGEGAIYKYDNLFWFPPETVSSGHSEPAGIFYNLRDDILAVPNYGSSTVDFLDMTTGIIINGRKRAPQDFTLYQSYPNPFNSSTCIKYELSFKSNVNISVYDVSGRNIVTLLDSVQPEGYYQLNWDAESLPSGIYFCRLQADNSNHIMKIVLLK